MDCVLCICKYKSFKCNDDIVIIEQEGENKREGEVYLSLSLNRKITCRIYTTKKKIYMPHCRMDLNFFFVAE